MKTTILTYEREAGTGKPAFRWIVSMLHLVLCGLYSLLLFELINMPSRHGFGGGNADTTLPFLILFLTLALIHLLMIFFVSHPGRILLFGGILLIIASAMSFGVLFFSRPSANLMRMITPDMTFIYGLLLCSLIAGGYGIIRSGPVFHSRTKSPEVFPFSPDRYRNPEMLTSGGVGTIWYAERRSDGRPVVLKVPVQDDERTGMSFLQELSLWKEFEHPNIVKVFAVNILPVPYIEMEYLDHSLADRTPPLSMGETLQIILGIVSALSYAHRRGIIHCDLKPTNILMDADDLPKLTDWGLSRSASSRWIVPGFSPRYAAPEQQVLHGECSKATDIWQTGLILTELLTGKTEVPSGNEWVFQGPTGQEILRIIRRCIQKNPKDRYSDANILMQEIIDLVRE